MESSTKKVLSRLCEKNVKCPIDAPLDTRGFKKDMDMGSTEGASALAWLRSPGIQVSKVQCNLSGRSGDLGSLAPGLGSHFSSSMAFL